MARCGGEWRRNKSWKDKWIRRDKSLERWGVKGRGVNEVTYEGRKCDVCVWLWRMWWGRKEGGKNKVKEGGVVKEEEWRKVRRWWSFNQTADQTRQTSPNAREFNPKTQESYPRNHIIQVPSSESPVSIQVRVTTGDPPTLPTSLPLPLPLPSPDNAVLPTRG